MNSTLNQTEQSTAQQPAATTPAKSLFPSRFVSPEVNIFKTKDGYVVEAELPGVTREGLEILVEQDKLTIQGRRESASVKAPALYRESLQADYRRVFQLDPAIDTTKIEAKLESGVLTITLPNSERVKPRKVAVTG